MASAAVVKAIRIMASQPSAIIQRANSLRSRAQGTTMILVRRSLASAIVALCAMWPLAQSPAAAQSNAEANVEAPSQPRRPPPPPPGPTPRLPDGRVDLSGVWRPADIFLIEDISLGLKKGDTISLKPEAAAL